MTRDMHDPGPRQTPLCPIHSVACSCSKNGIECSASSPHRHSLTTLNMFVASGIALASFARQTTRGTFVEILLAFQSPYCFLIPWSTFCSGISTLDSSDNPVKQTRCPQNTLARLMLGSLRAILKLRELFDCLVLS